MTANEARRKAESFNLIKNDTVYKKIQEAIQDSASNGRYYIIVDFPSFIIEVGDSGISYYIPIERRLDEAVRTLKNDGFKVTVRPSTCLDGHEVTVDWFVEEHE